MIQRILVTFVFTTFSWIIEGKTKKRDHCPLKSSGLGKFIKVPSGSFLMGRNSKYPEERNSQRVHVSNFLLQVNEVTNLEFSRFVKATGYSTLAERGKGSAVFIISKNNLVRGNSNQSWWRLDKAATWRTPEGEGSNLKGRSFHPVVHVTLEDAKAYAKWAGARLPSEVEWEYAASIGLLEPRRPDSGAIGPNGEARANIWNGEFPHENSGKDGFIGRAPVGCYRPNKLGAYDLLGNVWEWTSTPFKKDQFTIKGGSYLCSQNYCHRYRTAARQGLEKNFSTGHVGIRLVRDINPISNHIIKRGTR